MESYATRNHVIDYVENYGPPATLDRHEVRTRSSFLESVKAATGAATRKRRRRVAISDDDGRSASSLSVPAYPVTLRSPSPSARTTRSLPVTPSPPDIKTIEEVRWCVVVGLGAVLLWAHHERGDAHAERERERQQERLERIRRQKKMMAEDRTMQALKLLEKALEMDRMLTADKERQGKLLQDKLQEMKKKRSGSSAQMAQQDQPVIEDLEKY
ncbi:hypothetical protein C0Q70_16446 [Pomacea canaliculata]|uniref:Uncharacterized protein n=1 Tax=Pomacea canaliculata TaxID=400727 RepID=A0A2T7NPV7_POMCA|nr:hypothetical protein C0Q70_16446 [Pomacea canaliculata]